MHKPMPDKVNPDIVFSDVIKDQSRRLLMGADWDNILPGLTIIIVSDKRFLGPFYPHPVRLAVNQWLNPLKIVYAENFI